MSETVKVRTIPDCDLCFHFDKKKVPAAYDGATRQGPWANMCESHFAAYGIGLGTGVGQRLILDVG